MTVFSEYSKAWGLVVVLVSIPKNVYGFECLASHGAPVLLSISHGRDRSASVGGVGDWPAGLGHPDPFARRDSVDLVPSCVD